MFEGRPNIEHFTRRDPTDLAYKSLTPTLEPDTETVDVPIRSPNGPFEFPPHYAAQLPTLKGNSFPYDP